MDEHAVYRTERRISELECELRQVKLDADRMKWDLRRVEDAQIRSRGISPELYFWLFAGAMWLLLLVVLFATDAKTG